MKYILYFTLSIFSILACSKDDPTPMDDMDPMDNPDTTGMEDTIVMLEDVLSNFDIDINFRTCSSIDVAFTFDIIGDSTAIGEFGFIISNEMTNLLDTIERDYQSIPPDFLDLLTTLSTFQLDPSEEYEVLPFIEVGDSIYYGNSLTEMIGNFTEIGMSKLLDLNDYSLGFHYISEATAVRIGNYGYLMGGLVGNDSDPANQTVSDVFLEIGFDSKTIEELDPLPFAASSMVSFIYNGEIYVGGGRDGSNANTEFYKYTFSGWEFVTNYPNFGGLSGGYALNHNAYVYIGLGVNPGFNQEPLRDFYRYDPTNNSWLELKKMPLGASGGISFVIDDKIYVSHGSGSWFFEYDINTDTWKGLSGGGLLQDALSFSRDGKGYTYSGGYDQTGTSVEIYDPTIDEWNETCIESLDFRTYEGVIFDDGISDPVVGFGDNRTLFRLDL